MGLKGLFRHSLIKDSATLLSSNVWAQALSFGAYVILTRLFTQEEFGLYNVFYSYIEIFIILSTCKYELSVVVADNDREAAAVMRLALRLNAIVSAVLVGVVVMVHYMLPDSRFSVITGHLGMSLLIPVMVFFCGTTRVYTFLFNRFRGFGQIALSEVVTSTTGVVIKILLGLTRPLSWLHGMGLPLGTVLGKVAGNVNYLIKIRRLGLPRNIKSEEVRAVARKYKNYPLFSMPKDFLNSFSYNLPFLWLALYFDKAEIGLFGLALTFTLRPVNLLNNAIEKALFVRVSEKVREGLSIEGDVWKFVKYINMVAVPFFALAYVFAGPLFSFVFGNKWAGCDFYVRCLLPWVMVSLTSTPLMLLANVFGRQRGEFIFYVVLLVLRAASVLVGVVTGNLHLSILLFSLSGMLVSLSLLAWYMMLVREYERGLAR